MCYGALVAIGPVLFFWTLPAAVRFLPTAPVGFWVLLAIALLVDAPLYRLGRPGPVRVRSSLSACAALAVFVNWGAAPAIFVQAVAVVVAVLWERFDTLAAGSFISRHITAAAVAGSVAVAVGGVPANVIDPAVQHLARQVLLPFGMMAVVWLAVAFSVLALSTVVLTGYGPRRVIAAAGEELMLVAASILLVEPMLSSGPGWWSFVSALPLFAFSALVRVRVGRERQLHRDPVTGTLNAAGLDTVIHDLITYDYMRHGRLYRFGVILITVEELLTINRLFGREAYNQLIDEVARRFIRAYGPQRVGRIASEGLLIIVPGMTHESALSQAKQAARLVADPIEVTGVPFYLEPAAGAALSPDHGRDVSSLVAKAYYAVHEARKLGHPAKVYGRVEVDEANRRLAILYELQAALTDPARADEIGLLFQPQVRVDSGRIVGVEALVRWTHPQWGPVRADEVVNAIEPSAVMNQLTMRVLDDAVRQVREWADRGVSTRVAVNVSVRDLHQPGFAEHVGRVLERYRVAPRQLTIEITERMVISADPLVARAATRIARLGVGLSLDDFGIGFASVDQLRALPLTEVKIDRSYVEKISSSPEQWAIMQSLHGVTHALGLELVAEGVEDEQTVACLSHLPGVVGQGYFFGRPMDARQLEDLHIGMDRKFPARGARVDDTDQSKSGTKPIPS